MPVSTDQFHEAHAAIRAVAASLRDVARDVPRLTPADRAALRATVLTRLSPLESHMRLEERVMYPEVANRLRDPLATASMQYDHLAIRDWVRRIREAPLDPPATLQELLIGLDALIRVHLWKEDALYLRMLDSAEWPAA